MPLAALKIALGTIDETKGLIPGCRLAEVNRLATFAGKDGKPIELMITPTLIDGLLGLANDAGRLDAFWTHDRLKSASRDELHDSVGVWKNFRKDENGNLIADCQLAPTQYKDRIMWGAVNDPDGIMTSMVFKYEGGTNDAKPTRLDSADFVRFGAATTALLSAYSTKTENDMTPEEIKALVKEAVTAALASHTPAKPVEMTEADATAIMAAAGVTEADKKPEDATKPVAVRAQLAIARANRRLAEESQVQTHATLTGIVGTTVKDVIQGGSKKETDEFNKAIEAYKAAGITNRGQQVALLARNQPEIYNAALAAGRI